MNAIKRNILKTIAIVLIPVGLTGCQSGVSPHPFTTMFQQRPLDTAMYEADRQPVLPASLSHNPDENPSQATAAIAESTVIQ